MQPTNFVYVQQLAVDNVHCTRTTTTTNITEDVANGAGQDWVPVATVAANSEKPRKPAGEHRTKDNPFVGDQQQQEKGSPNRIKTERNV